MYESKQTNKYTCSDYTKGWEFHGSVTKPGTVISWFKLLSFLRFVDCSVSISVGFFVLFLSLLTSIPL